MSGWRISLVETAVSLTSGDSLSDVYVANGSDLRPAAEVGLECTIIVNNQSGSTLYLCPPADPKVTTLQFPTGQVTEMSELAFTQAYDWCFHHTAGGALSIASITVLSRESKK